jgi:hypothetical protein
MVKDTINEISEEERIHRLFPKTHFIQHLTTVRAVRRV